MLNQLLETIIQILTSWVSKFDSHAQHVEDKLDSLDQTASDIKTNTEPISDIKDNTGAVITPIQNIKTNTDSIATSSQTSANNTTAILNNVSTLSTNTGRAAAFAEDCANNTLDILDKVTTIASDTTQIRANTAAIEDIKDLMQYYFINTIVTEDSEGVIANFDTDLEDYLQSCNVTIPADPTGYTGITLTKCGKNLFDIAKYQDLRTNYEYVENSYYCRAIPLKPNTVYTLSQNAGTTDSAVILMNKTTNVNGPGYFDLRKSSDIKTFTTDNTGNLYIGIVSTGTDAQSNSRLAACNLQIEEADMVTEYEAYKANTYPVSFGSTITDGAEVDLLNGLVKVKTTPESYISITPSVIRTYKGVNNIFSDVGSTALTYRETLKKFIEKHNQ